MIAQPPHRGAALLLALAALLLGSTAAASALRIATTVTLAQRRHAESIETHALIRDLDPLLRTWSSITAQTVFRGRRLNEPDQGNSAISTIDPTGFIPVFDDLHEDLHVQIWAIDLSGRLHTRWLNAPIARSLPIGFRDLRSPKLRRKEDRAVASSPLLDECVDTSSAQCDSVFIPVGLEQILPSSALGRRIAALWLTDAGAGALNAHTAPMPLLEDAVRALRPTTAAEILRRRRAGDCVPEPLLAERRPDQQGPALTVHSQAIGFLAHIRHHAVTQRWWIVLERADGWRVTHRRRIP